MLYKLVGNQLETNARFVRARPQSIGGGKHAHSKAYLNASSQISKRYVCMYVQRGALKNHNLSKQFRQNNTN